MACKTESEMIGEHEFSVTQWDAEKAMLMKLKVMKTIGPAFALIAGDFIGDGEVENADGFAAGINTMFEHNSPEEIVALVKECVVGVACEGKRMTATSFNEIFSGDDLMDVYKVFAFVLKVNYGNFLKGRLVGGQLAKMAASL